MKRAPVIPNIHQYSAVGDTSLSTPAAPMVDSLIARVGEWLAVMPLHFACMWSGM